MEFSLILEEIKVLKALIDQLIVTHPEWNLKRPECKILPQNIPAYQTVDLTETIGVASLLPHWCIYSVDLPLVVYKLSEN
jgi:hypothetical protein